MEQEQAAQHDLALRFDPESRVLLARLTAAANARPVDEFWLREQLAARGCAALRLLPEAAATLLARGNAGQDVAEMELAEAVDATLRLTVTADHLEARLDVRPAAGGSAVSRGMILAALVAEGIQSGGLAAAIDAVVAAGRASGELIALGQAPEDGRDGWLETLLPEARDRRPHEDASGHIDYHDLGDILIVHPGDLLMRRHPPTTGRDGLSVTGKALPARPGKDAKFAGKLPGTALGAGDGDLLVAAIVGQPVIVKDGMAVEPIYKVDRVGSASGHINFDGNVVIGGDVDAGMSVCATGDIEIGGVVDMATLEAGGNIVVKGGVIGTLAHASGGEQHIRCGGCFNATYAQQAAIEAGDSIFIDDMALQCELSAVNHITVGNKQRGHIIGGSARAMLSITAKVIGSQNQGNTRLEIGVNPQMRAQQQALLHQHDGKNKQIAELGKLLTFAGQHPDKLAPDIVSKARATALALAAEIAELDEASRDLEHKIELAQEARVIAEKALHEGSDIRFGQHHYHTTREHGPCTIGLNEEGVFGPL